MLKLKTTDICFLIPSYNRYEKLSNLLIQINEYTGVGSIIYNDASTIGGYDNIEKIYENTKVIHGDVNNGRANFDKTIKTLFNEAIKSNYEYFIFIADDMILCDNFIEHTKEFFDKNLIVNLFSLSDSGWNCSSYIDGVFTISKSGLEFMYNFLPKKSRNVNAKSTGVWQTVTTLFCARDTKDYRLACLNYSLVQHDGNEDSKLHLEFRKLRPIIAYNFYNDFYGDTIKIISYSKSATNKKKSSDVISNGDVYNKTPNTEIEPSNTEIEPSNTEIEPSNTEIEPSKRQPESKPVNNSQITSRPVKLHKPEKQNTISRIPNDIALGKLRKSNLRFGKR
jgi:hypothetical protein